MEIILYRSLSGVFQSIASRSYPFQNSRVFGAAVGLKNIDL
jgi:hypothetical protein